MQHEKLLYLTIAGCVTLFAVVTIAAHVTAELHRRRMLKAGKIRMATVTAEGRLRLKWVDKYGPEHAAEVLFWANRLHSSPVSQLGMNGVPE